MKRYCFRKLSLLALSLMLISTASAIKIPHNDGDEKEVPLRHRFFTKLTAYLENLVQPEDREGFVSYLLAQVERDVDEYRITERSTFNFTLRPVYSNSSTLVGIEYDSEGRDAYANTTPFKIHRVVGGNFRYQSYSNTLAFDFNQTGGSKIENMLARAAYIVSSSNGFGGMSLMGQMESDRVTDIVGMTPDAQQRIEEIEKWNRTIQEVFSTLSARVAQAVPDVRPNTNADT